MVPDPRSYSRLPRQGVNASARTDGEVVPPQPGLEPPIEAGGVAPFSRVAEAHRVTAESVDTLLEHLPVGLLVVDRDGRVVFANEAARALRIERLEPLQWAVTRALLTEDAVREDEIEIVTPGQPRRWLSACVSPLRVPGVGVTAAFVTVADATARKRLREWDPVIQTLVNL
jgi:PAS domain-containing protein